MKLAWLLSSYLLLSISAQAYTLPSLTDDSTPAVSPHNLFISGQQNGNSLDGWVVDSGYRYSLFDDIDLFIGTSLGTRVDSELTDKSFMSGLSYQYSDRLLLKSTLHSVISSYHRDIKDPSGDSISAEFSSQYRVSDKIDVHATLGYQEWQQDVEVGLGFRF
ncbi:hypothetical protein [Vibrio porteresiae]|uniref:Uncharacterized protein n=1 Tax=Vibrio porteresiae DSM 19223 TaxID=1123496 RepID=A0ABZ0QGT1_9VIBR|nr:hypothetical protein [Vibrio porteresiae]WPC74658.1 hypothetical protein R8Z52_05420 [Vibrio porteresiae DSM 19223]